MIYDGYMIYDYNYMMIYDWYMMDISTVFYSPRSYHTQKHQKHSGTVILYRRFTHIWQPLRGVQLGGWDCSLLYSPSLWVPLCEHHVSGRVAKSTDVWASKGTWELILNWGLHLQLINSNTLWLFNIAMENGPFKFIDDVPIKTTIYKVFSMAMLNNQMVGSLH
jgi:hypothetical protein